ncbi:uncharacterized protein LOC121979967 [Zingiber officinale]|uniref:uncharacterized protein LOC121979967 n=1 Tax=Zingiber officinale TaxID=94328 RepID=UPI001C4C9BD9|nr:uncharacterized protein LOC121979967 [Zingiber officinale]
MTPKEVTDVIPFQLVYRGEAVVPVEVRVESDRVQLYNGGAVEWRLIELDLVDKAWDKAAVQLTTYLQQMRQNYNKRGILRSFQFDDLVWKRTKPVGDVTKLEAPWGGPFKIIQNAPLGIILPAGQKWKTA